TAEKQNPVDYGVQIRFIKDLEELRRPPKPRGKPGSYGVAVRVQGIAGQPFVVLNSGEKGSDSFGVQIKSDGSYPNPTAGPRPSGSVSSDSDLPENPYAGRQPRHGSSYSTSDEEASGGAVTSGHEPKFSSGTRPPGEKLRRFQSHGDLLGAATDEPLATGAPWANNTEAAVGTGDVDTKPLSSVDSLISKFDGKVQQRGRAARRGRMPSEERKRSQSLDGRVSHRDVPNARELSGAQRWASGVHSQPAVPAGSLSRPRAAAGTEEQGTRSQRATRGAEEPVAEQLQSKAQAELQHLKSTPDLLRDQQEVAQPGSSEHPKELIYSILKEGSSESEIALKRKTARLLEKMQELAGPRDACSQPQHRDLTRKVEELQEKLDEETKVKELLETREELEEALSSRQRQEEQLRLRERELTALKGALKEEVASHDKELDRVRQQYQSDMDELRHSMEGITQVWPCERLPGSTRGLRLGEGLGLKSASFVPPLSGPELAVGFVSCPKLTPSEYPSTLALAGMQRDQANLESERQKINAVVRNLQRELEESAEETGHWRDMFQKNKDELRTTKQELLQVKLEREEFEEELRELRERFAAAKEEVDQARSSTVDPGELEALRKELREARQAQRELIESREELLQQRERELAALKGTMQEEASSRHGELERCRRDVQQLQEERNEATKAKASLESALEVSEQARKAVESSLREVQEQNDDLRRKVLGLETHLKEYERLGQNWEGSQARLKEKVTKLEAERKQAEESLGEATEREQELLMAKRTLETHLEETQRSLARLTQEHQELSVSYQDEQRQKEQLKRAKNDLEEQKRLLDRTTEKLNKELEQMTAESHSSLAVLKSQLEEFKEKSRKEITDSQKQAKDRGAEVEKMQLNVGRLQDEVSRLKQALQDSQAERESALLDKEVLLQRLHNLEQEMEAKRRSQDDRSRHVKALEEKSKRLEVELDEEKTTVELLTERVNRSRDQIDQLRAELLQERSSRQDLECDKVSLERQNKELKNRLASSEGLQKPSSNISQLEARLELLQDKLQSLLLSSNRKLERKVKELTIQIDDERQHVSNQKDQLSLKVKALKRQVDEAEEEIERLEGARKKAQRELEEQHELNEQLQTRIKALEKEAW
ncbi:Cingulin, partial [Cuculus canorus]